MCSLFRKKYRIESARKKGYDYRREGDYFVTICTKDRQRFFGNLINCALQPTEIGRMADHFWTCIPEHFPFVTIDAYVIMPDHMHGILHFNQRDSNASGNGNRFGPQSGNLASVIRSYKGVVTSFAKKNGIEFAWHPRFYDRILKTPDEIEIVRRYIRNNPSK